MSNTEFNCLPTITQSVPITDPQKACDFLNRFIKDIVTWPQLPKKSFLENMYVQFSGGFPGAVVEDNRLYVDTAKDYSGALEALYQAYLENDASKYTVGQEYAAGLYAFLEGTPLSPKAVKGCVTGPLSWGMTVTDENKRPILYHEILGDAVPKFLKLKAAWEENQLKKISKNTLLFVDEPFMSSYGSSIAAGPFSKPEKIIEMIDEVFNGIGGLKGIHCCGNTDWSILLKTKMDILNFDAYAYAESLALYPDEVKKFLGRGGAIAWGIVPNDDGLADKESAASLKDRLEAAIEPFTKGTSYKDILKHSLLLPCCGLVTMSAEGAEQALKLLTDLSTEMRKKL